MKVTIFGSGYVGLVTGACLAEVGNDVLCVDIDPEKIATLKQGKVQIHEPSLEPMVKANIDAGRLGFTTDPAEGVAHGMYQFIVVGADIEQIRIGIGSDRCIGYHFIYPGAGYGGSCFPKDVKALENTAGQNGYNAKLLKAVGQVNEAQKRSLFSKIKQHFNGDLEGEVFALCGLAFKPNTDDMREAPSRVPMEALWAAGASVNGSV